MVKYHCAHVLLDSTTSNARMRLREYFKPLDRNILLALDTGAHYDT